MGADGTAIPGIGLPTDRLRLVKTDLGSLTVNGLTLKPEEMFVVSRLAGVDLRVSELLTSTGLPRAQSIAVITRLVRAGIFKNLDEIVVPPPAKVAGPPAPPPSAAVPPPVARAAIDPEAADLSPDLQHELVELGARVGSQNPREILGVDGNATPEEIKAAYFSLAQRFHPDQFFRKRLGSFKLKVDQVFARVAWAFQELVRDPTAGRTPAPVEADSLPAMEGETELATIDSNDLPELSAESAVEITGRPRDRFRKAMLKQMWAAAHEALDSLTTDEPNALDLPKLRAEVVRRQSEADAKALFDKGNALGAQSDWSAAFKCYQQASALDPRNATYVERAGRALLYEGDLKEAKRLVERALELKPGDAATHVTLGNVFLKAGMAKNAKRSFEAALKLDPKNEYAKAQVRKNWWKG